MIVTTTSAEKPSDEEGNSVEQPSADRGFEENAAPRTIKEIFFPAVGLQLSNAVRLDLPSEFFVGVDVNLNAEARSEAEDEEVVRACSRMLLETREPSPLTLYLWRLGTLTGQLCAAALLFTF